MAGWVVLFGLSFPAILEGRHVARKERAAISPQGQVVAWTTKKRVLNRDRVVARRASAIARKETGLEHQNHLAKNTEILTTEFMPYPDYTGNLSVKGSVEFVQSTSVIPVQVMSFNLTGTDPECTDTLIAGPNACGIHIHAGTSCSNHSLVGGHFWNMVALGDEDAWNPIRYTTVNGTATGSGHNIVTALTNEEVVDRVVVVHDASGARIACSLMGLAQKKILGYFGHVAPVEPEPPQVVEAQEPPGLRPGLQRPLESNELQTVELMAYPNYTGNLLVEGYVQFVQSTSVIPVQVMSFNLTGTDPECTATLIPGPNACGIHIHAGTSCVNHSLVGGHFWNMVALGDEDAWNPIRYTTVNGTATGSGHNIVTALTNEEVADRVVVVHDAAGARIACSLLRIKPKTRIETAPQDIDQATGVATTTGEGDIEGTSTTGEGDLEVRTTTARSSGRPSATSGSSLFLGPSIMVILLLT
jgi:hypothetical protein